MKHILLYARHIKKNYNEPIAALLDILSRYPCKLFAESVMYEFAKTLRPNVELSPVDSYDSLKKERMSYVLSCGGDGTILGATTLIRDLAIPILGINLGRLGFLASIDKDHLEESIDKLFQGLYTIEERSMIHLESSPELFKEVNFALNDFTLHKRDTSSMITIHTFINGDYLTSYWADGIIVSTPTGSTGYSLSCGGPIIFPESKSFVITPVAPHNLTIRPLVLSDDVVISFEIEGRTKNFLCTLDSRFESINMRHQLAIRKSEFCTRLIVLHGFSFLRTIHEKLSWGADSRN